MTESQKLTVRTSEIRTRLNELAGLEGDALTDEARAEIGTLTTEYRGVETRLQAAIVGESGEAELRAAGDPTGAGLDAETRAFVELRGRTSLGGYLSAFGNQEQLTGAERELNEHRGLSVAGNVLPWDALLPQAPNVEARADAATTAPASGNAITQAEIIQRVFARSALARLGVAMPSVPVGVASYPVITTGQTAAYVAAEATKDAAAGTITSNALNPVRAQARFQIRVEDTMITPGIEMALRQDLRAAIAERCSGISGEVTRHGFQCPCRVVHCAAQVCGGT